MKSVNIKTSAPIKRHHSRYITVSEKIHEALDLESLSLYMAFRYFSDFEKDDSVIKRSSKSLYEKAKISRAQFFRCLNILEDFGLIRREPDNTLNSISSYHVAMELGYFSTVCYPVSDRDYPVSGRDYPVSDRDTDHYPLPLTNSNLDISENSSKALKTTSTSKTLTLESIVADNPHNLPQDMIDDWITNRKAKKLPLTPRIWTALNNQLAKCDNPIEAFEMALLSGWQGFNAEWVNKSKPRESFYTSDSTAWAKDIEKDLW